MDTQKQRPGEGAPRPDRTDSGYAGGHRHAEYTSVHGRALYPWLTPAWIPVLIRAGAIARAAPDEKPAAVRSWADTVLRALGVEVRS